MRQELQAASRTLAAHARVTRKAPRNAGLIAGILDIGDLKRPDADARSRPTTVERALVDLARQLVTFPWPLR